MKFKKVQFISWEVYTGPYYKNPNDAYNGIGKYSGYEVGSQDNRIDILSQCVDIQARVAFTKDAIENAYNSAEESEDTLKIFLAPEFLYRGAGGAYLHDLLNGWKKAPEELGILPDQYKNEWSGLFGALKDLVIHDKYANWLFVFGTAISASFPTKTLVNNSCVLDASKPGEIYNTNLIQLGGSSNSEVNYASRKYYKSGIDFLKKSIQNGIVHENGNVKPFDPDQKIPSDLMGMTEGGAFFQLKGIEDVDGKLIDFGIEICLDHIFNGGNNNSYGRIKSAGKKVKIQLVPSGGMSLNKNSICLKDENSYAFNCDGMNGMIYGYGSHTQIWDSNLNPLYEASGGDSLLGTKCVTVANQVKIEIDSKMALFIGESLWNSNINKKGSGHIRVTDALYLSKK